MPVKDYAAYANSPKGLEARARARAKWVAARSASHKTIAWKTATLAKHMARWVRQVTNIRSTP